MAGARPFALSAIELNGIQRRDIGASTNGRWFLKRSRAPIVGAASSLAYHAVSRQS